LVTFEGFIGYTKPFWNGEKWVESATPEEIQEGYDTMPKPPSLPLTAEQLVDVLKYNGIQVWPL